MKIAVISDIYGNVAALDAVLADIASRQVDQIVNLGDICSGGLFPRETADRLMPLGLPTIGGNHDRHRSDQPRERMGLSNRHAFDQPGAEQRAFNKRQHNPCGFTADLSRIRIFWSSAAFCPSSFDLEECAGIAVEATTDIGAFSTSRAAL